MKSNSIETKGSYHERFETIHKSYWEYYLEPEDEFLDTKRFVEFDRSNAKCYPITNVIKEKNQPQKGLKKQGWHILTRISENFYVLCSTSEGHVIYAPLYIHSFKLITPRNLSQSKLLDKQYNSYEEIQTVPDRLRWCRLHLGLTKQEVAETIGISSCRYNTFEAGTVDYYPKEIVDKLAVLYKLPTDDLLDEFNKFLYYGQGKAICKHRQSLGLKRESYALIMNIEPSCLRVWENEKKWVTKKSWKNISKKISK